MKTLCMTAALLLPIGLVTAEGKKPAEDKKVPKTLAFTMKGNDGKDVDLSKYQGKVVLFVNVASKCGLTPQYKGLQGLHEKYNKDGFVVIGVPCNQFGKQEPGTDKEIAEFCTAEYKVTFPLLSKVNVNGGDACPLYKHLTSKETGEKTAGPIKWNFTKFLIGKNGELVGRFEPRVEPEEIAKAIEAELKK